MAILPTALSVARLPAWGQPVRGVLKGVWSQVPDVGSLSLQAARRLPNVHLVDWVDQNAILSHKSLGAFLTHGGHNSVSEAAYHGVPTVAVAIFADQSDSAARLVHHGSGIKLNKKLLDADKLQVMGFEGLPHPTAGCVF